MLNTILKNLRGKFCLPHSKEYICSCLLLAFIIVNSNKITAQCYASGYRDASSFTTDNSVGVYDFSDPSDAATSNNNRANASALISILSGNTYYLVATGFGFTIPSYASVCGITVEIECRATGLILTAAVRDDDVRLVKGGVITGADRANGTNWGSTDNYMTYGNSSDLWGTTLLPADVNASNFGVAISCRLIALVAALPSAQIDHIRMNIHYNPILPVSLAWFNAEKKGNKVKLDWKTSEEEVGSAISVERSFNSGSWKEIYKQSLTTASHGGKSYQYQDALSIPGDYSYRIRMESISGMVTYSSIKNIRLTGKEILTLYPNPASDYIQVDNAQDADIKLFSISLQEMPVRIERTGLNSYRLSVHDLPPGYYVLKTGSLSMPFTKK